MTAPFRFPRFFVTSPQPCPYLPGRQERKVFTELTGPHAGELNDALGRIGFRRSQSVAYRPSCAGCTACVSVRVLARQFAPNATQRKLMRRHADLEISACRPWATDEQYQLLRRYLTERHPVGGMAGMDEVDYADMVEQSPVNSVVVEYREPERDGVPGRLVGACLTDRHADGLSMIYSFFAVDEHARPGLGNLIILDHIERARAANLPYVYLGYWVKGSARMAYKTRYLFDQERVNILELSHQRIFTNLPAKGLSLDVECEPRDRAHLDRLLLALRAAGYTVATVELA